MPLAQNAWSSATLAVRTERDATPLVPAIKAAIGRVDRNQAFARVRTIEEVASASTARPRFRAQLLTVARSADVGWARYCARVLHT